MGFSYDGARSLPIWQRQWFVNRVVDEMKRAHKNNSDASRAAHSNTPDARAIKGMQRAQVPAKLRRFT